MFSATFLALTLAVSVFASPSANVSVYDSFRAIALQVPPKPDLPICCLKPLTSDSQDDDVLLLSFEEWKAKQIEVRDKEGGVGGTANRNESGDGSLNGAANPSENDTHTTIPANSQEWEAGPVDEPISPHFRVPITDRFNYASLDCSARIHHSHRSAKSASSILSSKRDKYMLSPCRGKVDEKQFVIVELCEDIRIDTVQMANYEFFSGVFKDFSVSVAKTYNTGWVDAGSYRAKNIRGVQSFHTPPTLRDFYRFIRVDFHSFYGNEYYCPVSLLRVYGLTHLEQWKWDMWEAESNANRVAAGDKAIEAVSRAQVQIQRAETTTKPITEALATNQSIADSTPTLNPTLVETISLPSSHMSTTTNETPSPLASSPSQADVFEKHVPDAASTKLINSTNDPIAPHPTDVDSSSPIGNPTSSLQSSTPSSPPETMQMDHSETSTTVSTSTQDSQTNPSVSADHYIPTASSPSASPPSPSRSSIQGTPSVTSQTETISIHHPPPPPPTPSHPLVSGGGESIYRTIMNRLVALESNHTLYARYVEDQIGGIRGVLRRLSEDVGRLEGIGKGQSQMYARTVKEWEKHRARIDADYAELLHRVSYLTDEVILEKRLGIAQLCLLLAVLVFMGLTRGSRMSEADLQSLLAQRIADRDRREREKGLRIPGARGVREWGRRHLSSISGDWVNRFRSRSPGDDEVQKENVLPQEDGRIVFPTLNASKSRPQSTKRYVQRKPRSRTPSLRSPLSASRHYLTHHNMGHNDHPSGHKTAPLVGSDTQNRPSISRANSHTGPSMMPTTNSWSGIVGRELVSGAKSAKRWARSAHLHEIKVQGRDDRTSNQDNALTVEEISSHQQIDDVFSSPLSSNHSRHLRSGITSPRSLLVHHGASLSRSKSLGEGSEGDGWVDTDTAESVNGNSSSSDVSEDINIVFGVGDGSS